VTAYAREAAHEAHRTATRHWSKEWFISPLSSKCVTSRCVFCVDSPAKSMGGAGTRAHNSL
jgi:hypothetical protein